VLAQELTVHLSQAAEQEITVRKTVSVDGRRLPVAEFEALEKLNVTGDLNLYDVGVKKLPDNLSVGGSLYLSGTSITALPDNLSVGGSLDLRWTSITALPDNLSVGGYLQLDPYDVTFPAAGEMKIGCERHTIDAWEAFTDSEITAMDRATVRKFWAKWKVDLIRHARAIQERGQFVDHDEDAEDTFHDV
jgi:hypothetical protein